MKSIRIFYIIFSLSLMGCSQENAATTATTNTKIPIKMVDGKPVASPGQSGSKAFRGADNINEVPPQYQAMVKQYQSQNKSKSVPKVATPK